MKTKGKFNLSYRNIITVILITIAAIVITVVGIAFKQKIIRMIPLYVSLIVGFLQSRASRYSYILGALNSVVYAGVYFSLGLYASMLNALLVSFPVQAATFVRWSKRSYKHSTEFKKLSANQWILVGSAFGISYAALCFIMSAVGSSYMIIDNTASLIGILVSILTLFAFREYSYLMLLTGVINIILNLRISIDDPAMITYLMYSVYSMVCIVMQFFAVRKLYNEQKIKNEINVIGGSNENN